MGVRSLTGAVLAGGKSERMGRQDKGLLLFQGQPMILPIIRAVSELTDRVFVNANQNEQEYKALGFDVVADPKRHAGRGPLSGLLTCLVYADSTHLLVSPCDTPCITSSAFSALLLAAQKNPDQIHYLVGASRKHPLHAILPVQSGTEALKAFLGSEQGYSVMAFYEAFGCQQVVWENDSELLNVNTPDALR